MTVASVQNAIDRRAVDRAARREHAGRVPGAQRPHRPGVEEPRQPVLGVARVARAGSVVGRGVGECGHRGAAASVRLS